jgi:ABC-2 type transport system ATP-binding protein
MRLMLGLDNGDGRTTFDGIEFRAMKDPMRSVGALLEAKAFHPTRKARNHLRLLAAANNIPDTRVDEVMAMVGLNSVAGDKPKKFSLGMGQRLGIAAALLGDPHTLVLDEPANGLDPQGITWLRNLLKRSIFVSSHLLSEMALLADQLVVIGRGQLITSGSVADFITANSRTTITVRSPDMSLLGPALAARGAYAQPAAEGAYAISGISQEEVGDVAHEAGARIHELMTHHATLEEAFLDATGRSEEFVGSIQRRPPMLPPPGWQQPPGGQRQPPPGPPPAGPPPGGGQR